jgi:hypothetical protein
MCSKGIDCVVLRASFGAAHASTRPEFLCADCALCPGRSGPKQKRAPKAKKVVRLDEQASLAATLTALAMSR